MRQQYKLGISIRVSDADPVEFLYGSGSRIRKSSIQIRIRVPDPDPMKKTSQNSIFPNFVEKNVLTDIEQQLYIKLAKVPRGQLRSQKSCKVP